MTIATIMQRKGERLVSVECDTPVREAVRLLAEHRIGSLPVVRDGSVAGIMSERDIVYCLARDGAEVLEWQVEKVMSGLSVETFGAASTRYPDGPKYVHYVNNADPVPTLTGLGGSGDPLAFLKDAGKGAVVHRFTDGNLNPISNHMLDTLYLKHRVDFDQARAGRF